MSSPWTVQCDVAGKESLGAEEVAGIASMHLFDAGALAVGEDAQGNGIRLIAGFEDREHAERAAAVVAKQMPDAQCRVIEDLSHRDWVDAQQASFQPTTIGPFTVRAPWHSAPELTGAPDNTFDIVIDPGAAFGHGAHPSTQLAIELMLDAFERPDVDPDAVVDLGTGTGVIAIIAAKLGFTVRATDTDPAAIEATEKNVMANSVAIELTLADGGELHIDASDFVVANVTIDVHRLLAPTYAAADHIVVSGLLCGQVAEMRGLLTQHRAATIRTSGDWAAVNFVRSLLER